MASALCIILQCATASATERPALSAMCAARFAEGGQTIAMCMESQEKAAERFEATQRGVAEMIASGKLRKDDPEYVRLSGILSECASASVPDYELVQICIIARLRR